MVDSSDVKFKAVCNLMRRLPPKELGKCVSGINEFIDEDLQEQIIQSIDQPLGKLLYNTIK